MSRQHLRSTERALTNARQGLPACAEFRPLVELDATKGESLDYTASRFVGGDHAVFQGLRRSHLHHLLSARSHGAIHLDRECANKWNGGRCFDWNTERTCQHHEFRSGSDCGVACLDDEFGRIAISGTIERDAARRANKVTRRAWDCIYGVAPTFADCPYGGLTQMDTPIPAAEFRSPAVLLSGKVDYDMYANFRRQFDASADRDLVVVELSTLGGDPEVARMMGEDIRFASEMSPSRRFVFLGKAAIYSAGTTFMSFFARRNRYLTRGTRLMVHERKLSKELRIDGPLTTCVATVEAALHEILSSIEIQNEGFQNLVNGSTVSMDEVLRRAPSNWYIEAEEAKTLGLIEAVL